MIILWVGMLSSIQSQAQILSSYQNTSPYPYQKQMGLSPAISHEGFKFGVTQKFKLKIKFRKKKKKKKSAQGKALTRDNPI